MTAFTKTRNWPKIVIGIGTALVGLSLLLRHKPEPQRSHPGQEPLDREPFQEGYSLEETEALRAKAVEEARQTALKASLHVY